MSAIAHKEGRRSMAWRRRLQRTSEIAALVVVFALTVGSASAEVGRAIFTCTNPSSGATWQIHVDYDRRTVDSNPAGISDETITWQDNGWKYSLDRKSGKLTVVVASSTGGNFLYDQCRLDK